MENIHKLIITPKTKILQLIETYPKLEEILIEYAPVFKKLKNPILRRTVAKIATIQQAAAIGNVKVEDMINHLRKEVGQDLVSGEDSSNYTIIKPDWFDPEKVKLKLDASEMLAAGEHPVNQAIADLKKLAQNEIYELHVPFLPAPLIDKASSLNFKHWVNKKSEEEFIIYFCK